MQASVRCLLPILCMVEGQSDSGWVGRLLLCHAAHAQFPSLKGTLVHASVPGALPRPHTSSQHERSTKNTVATMQIRYDYQAHGQI